MLSILPGRREATRCSRSTGGNLTRDQVTDFPLGQEKRDIRTKARASTLLWRMVIGFESKIYVLYQLTMEPNSVSRDIQCGRSNWN